MDRANKSVLFDGLADLLLVDGIILACAERSWVLAGMLAACLVFRELAVRENGKEE